MNLVRSFSLAGLLLAIVVVPAVAGTIVSNPVNGTQLYSPLNLTMTADTCSTQPVTFVGYSLDNSTNTQIFAGQNIDGLVSAPNRWHILHVKVWNNAGGVCVTDVSIDVVPAVAGTVVYNPVNGWQVPSPFNLTMTANSCSSLPVTYVGYSLDNSTDTQIFAGQYYSHNDSGWVTYHSVWLDGAEQDLGATVFSGYALGWGPAILTNFQIDGDSSGTTSAIVYLDDMTVYQW